MKTLFLRKSTSALILLAIASIFICALTVGFSTYAFADECEQSDNQNQAILGDYEDDAENDRIASTFAEDGKSKPNYEIKGRANNVYYVWNTSNTIKRKIRGKDFIFKYDLRGYIGDRKNHLGRKANVQYFYNIQTKVMVFLTFGNGEIGFNTYQYHGTGNTIFENNVTYVKNKSTSYDYSIAENVEKCYLDPRITKIGQYNFQCCTKLNLVDIINEEYDNVHMEIGDCAFRKAGYDKSSDKTWTPTEVKFFKAYDQATQIFLLSSPQRERWAGYCWVKFNDIEYDPVD